MELTSHWLAGDDEKAKEMISRTARGGNEIVEVIGNIRDRT